MCRHRCGRRYEAPRVSLAMGSRNQATKVPSAVSRAMTVRSQTLRSAGKLPEASE